MSPVLSSIPQISQPNFAKVKRLVDAIRDSGLSLLIPCISSSNRFTDHIGNDSVNFTVFAALQILFKPDILSLSLISSPTLTSS